MKAIKLIPVMLIILALGLSSCNYGTTNKTEIPTAKPYILTKENYPRVDGSTANIPLGILLAQKTAGVTADEADVMTNFTTTPYAYSSLVARNSDILLVYEGSADTKKMLNDTNIQLESYPIGLDALVFIVNETNPVNSLKTTDIQMIYQGKITNWKEVGGNDEPIVAYQRNEESGSQALMRKLVMKDLPMAKAPQKLAPMEMGGLIEELASFNNTGNSIGYSVYYYAKNMYTQPGLKFIAVDGVDPSNETIANKSYPHINEFYAIIRKEEPNDSNTRRLLNYILSPEGEKTIEEAGYIAINSGS